MQQKNQLKESPNLISPKYTPQKSEIKFVSSILTFNKLLLFAVNIVTVIAVLYRISLSNEIKVLDQKIEAKNNEVLSLQSDYDSITHLAQKVSYFEKIRATSPRRDELIKFIYTYTPAEIVISRLDLEEGTLLLNLETKKSEYFAKFVISYLNTGKVSQIVLSNANYISEKDYYIFGIEVHFK